MDTTEARRERLIQREVIVLALLSVVAVCGFLATRAAAVANRRLQLQDAAVLYTRGVRALEAADAEAAIEALRRASALDVDNRRYRLGLARALAANREVEPARHVLIGLRARLPEDPHVNLQLARLETRRGDTTAAVRYYHNALYGAWGPDGAAGRNEARVELVQYLLKQGDARRALAELLVFEASLPDDPRAHLRTAELFLSAGDARNALEHFERVLDVRPRDEHALTGAAEAAFALQDYRRVVGYLRTPLSNPRAADLRRVAQAVVSEDPLQARLARTERLRRTAGGLTAAIERLDACGARRPLDGELTDLRGNLVRAREALTLRAIRDNPDLIDDLVALLARVHQRADLFCGSTPRSRAWIAISRLHRVSTA